MQTHVDFVELDAARAGALFAVRDWDDAFARRDADRLLALAAPEVELVTPGGAARGPAAVRRLVERQTYGVAQHVCPRRYLAGSSVVVVEVDVELRWVDTGELAETMRAAAVFDLHDGRITRFRALPDVNAAIALAASDRALS